MSSWAAKQLSEMTLEQKVGQLLVSRASVKDVDALVSEGIVGGLYVSNDVPAERIKELKALAATPLLIAQDLEAGYTSGSLKWSSAMSLAAVGDERLAYDWAYMHGLEARRAGVNAVFGPVLDIAMNRQGELCGIRTLGSDPRQAAQLAAAVVSGYQAAGLLPFAKHFPGFGRGIQDAHIELSELNADRATMWEEDLLPYRIAIDKSNLMGVMTGHISVPSINPDVPLPMSRRIMQLLDDIGFRGLAITDSLMMKGILIHYTTEQLYPGVIQSGHDLILGDLATPDRIGHGYLLQAVLDGRIPLEVLDRKVLRILEAKEKVCLPEPLPYSEAEHERTFQRIAELSMTGWRKDGGDFSPFAEKDRPLFVIVTGDEVEVEGELPAGANQSTELAHKLKSAFRGSELVVIPRSPTTLEMQKVLNKGIQASSICFIAHTPTKCYTGTNRYLAPIVSLAKGLRTKIRTFVIWGNPYASDDLPMEQFLFCYDRGPWIDPMIQVLKGERKPEGKLPVPML